MVRITKGRSILLRESARSIRIFSISPSNNLGYIERVNGFVLSSTGSSYSPRYSNINHVFTHCLGTDKFGYIFKVTAKGTTGINEYSFAAPTERELDLWLLTLETVISNNAQTTISSGKLSSLLKEKAAIVMRSRSYKDEGIIVMDKKIENGPPQKQIKVPP